MARAPIRASRPNAASKSAKSDVVKKAKDVVAAFQVLTEGGIDEDSALAVASEIAGVHFRGGH